VFHPVLTRFVCQCVFFAMTPRDYLACPVATPLKSRSPESFSEDLAPRSFRDQGVGNGAAPAEEESSVVSVRLGTSALLPHTFLENSATKRLAKLVRQLLFLAELYGP